MRSSGDFRAALARVDGGWEGVCAINEVASRNCVANTGKKSMPDCRNANCNQKRTFMLTTASRPLTRSFPTILLHAPFSLHDIAQSAITVMSDSKDAYQNTGGSRLQFEGRPTNWAETPKGPRIETHIAIWKPGVLASGGMTPYTLPANPPVYKNGMGRYGCRRLCNAYDGI